jgi:hypothetical protein
MEKIGKQDKAKKSNEEQGKARKSNDNKETE